MFFNTFLSNPILFLRIIIIVLISTTVHELAHGLAALSQGDKTPQTTGHMTLNPIVHMGVESLIFLCLAGISWGQMPINTANFHSPRLSHIVVAAAGPLSNLGMATGAIGLLRMISFHNWNEFISSEFLYLFAQLNLTLYFFNLLPLPLLDGFHVASGFFPELKKLGDSHFSYFALAIIFVVPGVGEGLSQISNTIVQSMVM
jgi:Zn-dependent protease